MEDGTDDGIVDGTILGIDDGTDDGIADGIVFGSDDGVNDGIIVGATILCRIIQVWEISELTISVEKINGFDSVRKKCIILHC